MKEKQLLDVDLSTFSYKVLRQEQWSTFLITGDNLKINYCLYKLIERVYNQQDIKHQFIPAFTCHLSAQSRHGAAHTFFHIWTAVERTKIVTKMVRANCLFSVLIRICNVHYENMYICTTRGYINDINDIRDIRERLKQTPPMLHVFVIVVLLVTCFSRYWSRTPR